MNKYFIGKFGIVFIVIGVLGAIGILLSFDWSTYSRYKDLSATYETELLMMKPQMLNTIVLAAASLLVNVAIGTVMMALDKIMSTLKIGASDSSNPEGKPKGKFSEFVETTINK